MADSTCQVHDDADSDLLEVFDDGAQHPEENQGRLYHQVAATPEGSRRVLMYLPFGAVLDHWKQDKHDVFKFVDNKTLWRHNPEGAYYIDADTPTITAMFRCQRSSCTRLKCTAHIRSKLSAAITRVVEVKGPYSLMITIPRLTDTELKTAYDVAEEVARHLQNTFDGVKCWGLIAVVEHHKSGTTEASANRASSSGQRTQYPYHLHIIVPVALESGTQASHIAAEANCFLRQHTDEHIYQGTLPMGDMRQECAAIAFKQKTSSVPYASMMHINELAKHLGQDDYLYDYLTKGMVAENYPRDEEPTKGLVSKGNSRYKNSVAAVKRHQEINKLLGGRSTWYRASTLEKGNKSFFHVAEFQNEMKDKYRSLVSDNYRRREMSFHVSVSYKGITLDHKVTTKDLKKYLTLSAEEALSIIKEDVRQSLIARCVAIYNRQQVERALDAKPALGWYSRATVTYEALTTVYKHYNRAMKRTLYTLVSSYEGVIIELPPVAGALAV